MDSTLFDTSIESLMKLDAGSSFIWNENMLCILKEKFNAWHKDCNSSSQFSEAHIALKCGNHDLDGLVVVQHDKRLSQKYYASVFIKQNDEDKWQSMFTINFLFVVMY